MLSKMLYAGAATMLVACGTSQSPIDRGSDLSQLTNTDFKCVEYTDAQVAANLQGMPAGFMAPNTWRAADLVRAKNALAGLPQGYLEYLYGMHEFNGFTVSQRSLEQGVGGVTTFTNVPLRIEIAKTSWAADFATQHEVGHAMNVGFRANRAGFENRLAAVFQSESGNAKLRSYARTTRAEYFAESFNNFYCSKEAHAFLKATLPQTYDFLNANLTNPRWESDTSSLLSADVFASLGGNERLTDVAVGAAKDIASVGLCRDSLAACIASKRSDVRFAGAGTTADRALFRGLTGLNVADGQVVTILGFDASGAVKAARAMKFQAQ